MSGIFGGDNPGQIAPAYTGMQLQTSSSMVCVPLGWGRNRGAPNLIWYGDFSSTKQHASGKGAGPVVGYDYKASLLMALCQGPITGIGMVWVNSGFDVPLSQSKFSLVADGNSPQPPWSYLTSNFPSQAFSYNGVALVASVKYDLGGSPYPPSTAFEPYMRHEGTAPNGADADPALIIQEFLGDSLYWGVGIPDAIFENLLSTADATTTGDGTYQTYCRAMGFGLSPYMQNQEQALGAIDRWTKLTNTAPCWTGYSFKFVPYGDQTVSANGVTYVPNLTPVYTLTDDDFVDQKDADPITCNRKDPADCYNSVRITINDRTMWYDPTPVELDDLALIQQYGDRPDSSVQATEVCDLDVAATIVGLMLSRAAYIRNTYICELPSNFCLLEPMDILAANDPVLGPLAFRIIDIEETDDGTFKITGEELTAGLSSPGGVSTPSNTSSSPPNEQVTPDPVNAPIIFEPPSTLAGTPQVWIAASGGSAGVADPNWGGCNVWLSADGSTYSQIGTITGPARMGVLSANLPAYGGANPDTTDTLAVNMAESAGELISASATAAAAYATLSYCDGELLAFETATLTGANAYGLTTLYRGLYGTTPGSHASGAQFARLDGAIFEYDLPAAYIGKTLYVKLQSFNVFGYQTEDLSTCTAYTYTPTGAGYGGGAGGTPKAPTGLTATAVSGGVQLGWTANAVSDNVTSYVLFRAPGTGASFGSASPIWEGQATSYTDAPLAVGSGYTYFLVAVNAIGDSANTAGVNATPNPAPGGASTDTAKAGATVPNLAPGFLADVAGVSTVVKADAAAAFNTGSPTPLPANCFVVTGGSSGATLTIYAPGSEISGLSGLSPGATYYLQAGGGMGTALPTSGAGNARQSLGWADSTGTKFYFNPGSYDGI